MNRVEARLSDIIREIERIKILLEGKSERDLENDWIVQHAFEKPTWGTISATLTIE